MTDPKVTKEIQDWLLHEPKTNEMALSGAMLLQRINPRNFIYRRWLSLAAARPNYIMDHIEAELKKHLQYRLDGLTLEEVRRLDQRVVPEAQRIITEGEPEMVPVADSTDGADSSTVTENNGTDTDKHETVKTLGKRPDHEQLPDDIKQLWDQNGETYKKIKAVFEELKSMDNLPSCDRYEKLQVLASLDADYLKKMETYDNYVIGSEEKKQEDGNSSEIKKNIGSARSYLSKNLQKLQELRTASSVSSATEEDKEAYRSLLEKMQQRLDIIMNAGAPVTDELMAIYEQAGLAISRHGDAVQRQAKSGE